MACACRGKRSCARSAETIDLCPFEIDALARRTSRSSFGTRMQPRPSRRRRSSEGDRTRWLAAHMECDNRNSPSARGAARAGAGRKRIGPRPRVRHRTREALSRHHPVHVTVRLRDGLPSLRRDAARAAIERSFSVGAERFGFRLTQYSIQSNHVHLIAEACDRRALSRGMQGLLVRVARALNRLWRRIGSLFADRYHARPLRTPREVRAALVYVIQNARRHGVRVAGIDAFSSGPWFDGWMRATPVVRACPAAAAQTWLLRTGWRRHGLVSFDESPRPVPPARAPRVGGGARGADENESHRRG